MTRRDDHAVLMDLVRLEVLRVVSALNLKSDASRALTDHAVGLVCRSLGMASDATAAGGHHYASGLHAALRSSDLESLIRLRASAVIRARLGGFHQHTPFLRRVVNTRPAHKEQQS